tara:strand:+ start:417 stop:545 length:129 start_codon:yes stop_codon:yes gene_type:complete
MVLISRESRDNFENREMSNKKYPIWGEVEGCPKPPTPQKMTN